MDGCPLTLRIKGQTKEGTNGTGETNVGSMNTIEDDMGRPGINSNQMPTIQSLHNSGHNNNHTNRGKALTETDVDESCGERPM
jgi:hypothetical protein